MAESYSQSTKRASDALSDPPSHCSKRQRLATDIQSIAGVGFQEAGWVTTTDNGIGVRASRSIMPPAEGYQVCKTQNDMLDILANTTINTHVDDANLVAEFIMSTKQPQAMVSVAFHSVMDRALLDSGFAYWSSKPLHIIFKRVTKDKNPPLGSRTIKPKKFSYSATEVARKNMNARGESKVSPHLR